MPFCPECRIEYIRTVSHCSDCGAALIEQLPEEPALGDVKWVMLAELPSEVEGNMLREALEAEGIRTLLRKDIFVASFGSQGTVILVAERDAEEARSIQKALLGRSDDD